MRQNTRGSDRAFPAAPVRPLTGRLWPRVRRTTPTHVRYVGGPDRNHPAFSPRTENVDLTHGVVGWSGKKMWSDDTPPDLYDRAPPAEPDSRRGSAGWTTGVVLINLATNDSAGGIPDEAGGTDAYKQLLARIRRNHPKAAIDRAIDTMTGDWPVGNKPLTILHGYFARVVAGLHEAGDTTYPVLADQYVRTLGKDLQW